MGCADYADFRNGFNEYIPSIPLFENHNIIGVPIVPPSPLGGAGANK